MSWGEENVIDLPPEFRTQEEREEEWKNGLHTTAKGETKKLVDMDIQHLTNTIRKFKAAGCNVSALEKELKNRK